MDGSTSAGPTEESSDSEGSSSMGSGGARTSGGGRLGGGFPVLDGRDWGARGFPEGSTVPWGVPPSWASSAPSAGSSAGSSAGFTTGFAADFQDFDPRTPNGSSFRVRVPVCGVDSKGEVGVGDTGAEDGSTGGGGS